MARTVNIGAQGFEVLRAGGDFYVDKTGFIREWWESRDVATLVCRPRRFGKTLNLDTLRCFLSTEYAGRGEELFGGLEVWGDPAMRGLQGTVPVVSLSFAKVKERDRDLAVAGMKRVLADACHAHDYLLSSDRVPRRERERLEAVSDHMDDGVAADCINQLCRMLRAHWGVAPVVLLDEYDTPMQEAWLGGWWDDAVAFQRALFNATFKTNPALGRGLMTGVTRVSRESIFSDLNNLRVVTTFSNAYATSFGFTETEVAAALDEYGRSGELAEVRRWYDGFVFGDTAHIYNPWSITSLLKEGDYRAWWANTSGNGLVSTLVREGDASLKEDFETLLAGGTLPRREVADQVVFSELGQGDAALWGLLVGAGYLRTDGVELAGGRTYCDLALTNHEVLVAFEDMVGRWFGGSGGSYNEFCRALLAGDAEAMTAYLGDVAQACMSSFDTGRRPSSRARPERFWHGLALGLLVGLRGRYSVESNRESGFGRCDVMLCPLDPARDDGIVLEFKAVSERHGERTLEDAVASALAQIGERGYTTALRERGARRVRAYGMAFSGKEVLVG